MPAPDIIPQLVERFEQNRELYRLGKYNETQLRREFLDPFFEALGWDVTNKQGYAELYKDVVHEDSLEVEGGNRAPDYAFRIGGTRKFLVEAKKPAVNIAFDIHPAYQLRRYAWSARLPLGILTDFEEFAVYDCRIKPDKKDKASIGRNLFLSYREYSEQWEQIAAVFSREAILKGSFDRYAEGLKGKKGTTEVDDAFLAEIERWRELLARNIALRNPGLNVRELNYAVQMTIDRIVFLRICEDRGIERDEQLKEFAAGKNVYENLCRLFLRADLRYNSGLFHFKDEKGQSSGPDALTPVLKIDDKVLQDMLKNLYYPESPYVFREIPADILGQVYERFLGKVIRLTSGHQAKVEEKPEVRKAGGVYYTPTYIVDYIVRNTVGALLEGKSPKEAAQVKILDPACGSGTFLLGSYQYLLDWHLKWYTENELERSLRGSKPVLFQSKAGYQLTSAKKKEILLNNIFGVDIDAQAVEVTKLSLLLKVLEGESQESIGSQLALFQERVLPDLGRNIQCGNSLIGPDYYQGRQLPIPGNEEERYRVNAFDWQAAFEPVFLQGGFDAVIGNPPYIRIQTLQETSPVNVDFFKKKYRAASKGNYDIYVVFVEKGLGLLNARGRLGFILPHKFFNAKYGEPLRELIAKGKHLAKVVHFGDQQVFENATTYTCMMFLDKSGRDEFKFLKVQDLDEWRTSNDLLESKLNSINVTSDVWNFSVGESGSLFTKLSRIPIKLGSVCHLFVGLQTDADDVFIVEEVGWEGSKVLCRSKYTGKEHWFEGNHLKPLLKGSLNIRRYYLSGVNKRLVFPYISQNGKSVLIEEKEYKSKFPLTWEYLKECASRLKGRNKGKMRDNWYGYVYKKNHTRFTNPKLLVPSIATGSCFAADLEGNYYFVGSGGGGGGGYGITVFPEVDFSYFYLLGILNSKLLSAYLKTISTPFQHGYFALNRQYIEQLPIHTPTLSDPADKTQYEKLVSLVERMLELHERTPRTPQEQEMVKREIAATDREIDDLVYQLYGLTDEEIRIVEGEG
jgi:type I restriction-modification system DNA methylase subunit